MREAIAFAVGRAGTTLVALLGCLGAGLTVLLVAPDVEVKLAPPISEWEISDATRDGDVLSWRVTVTKNRHCAPTIVWFARWGPERQSLRVSNSYGAPFRNLTMVEAGERFILGPFRAPVPRGWQSADGIEIDAIVTYDCGSPWKLPPINVRQQRVKVIS